jgi:pyruvate,water dikinase
MIIDNTTSGALLMTSQVKRHTFPLPSEIRSPEGAEGWEEMYPYFTRFLPQDDQRFWFCNSMHFPEPMPPFDALTAEIPYIAMGAYTTRVFAFPAALGIDYRIVNGRVYITANTVTDPKEIERRAKVFGERAPFYYEHWNELYEEWTQRMLTLIKELDAIRVPELPEFEDAEVVNKARGFAQNHELRGAFHRTIESLSMMWQHHFEFLMLGYGAYLVFFQFCKQAFPEISDQMVARMVAGIDVLMFRPDDEIKRLARVALSAGIERVFMNGGNPDEILAAVRSTGAPGERWLKELEIARHPWFNVSAGDGFYHYHRGWNDDLSLPLSALPSYITQIQAGKNIDRPTEALKTERTRIIKDYRQLLATDADRGAFDQMIELCHRVFPYVENHKFYCEQWHATRFFNKIREFGALLVRQGVLEGIEDIFQLRHTEIDEALSDVAIAWAAGSAPVGGRHWKPIVARRKVLLERLKGWDAPVALGPVPERIEDPAVQMLWGITSETLEAWSTPPEQDRAHEIKGYAASPGVAEGIARVLTTINEFGLIRDGEILVCPVTAPSWAPLFNKIKAAVSDIGGAMSHAAIVAREYGLPAVVGTGQATKRIRTGQRIRVDGNRGIVTILE